jgi:hypothetical protein
VHQVGNNKCLNGVCLEFLSQFVLLFAEFEPLENMVEDVRRLVQEVGLVEVRDERVKELLDSHGQQHCNADLKELANWRIGELAKLAKELSQQREEQKEKDKDPPLKCTKTSDLQRILSAKDTFTYELCDTDHEWQRSA